jgi:baculoviral IAP repeat-containing protein 7/8
MDSIEDISVYETGNSISSNSDDSGIGIIHEVHPTDFSYKVARERLFSFTKMPTTIKLRIFKESLAEAGFYITSNLKHIKCFSCEGIIDLDSEDLDGTKLPVIIHTNYFPNCKFVCGEDVGNRPMYIDPFRSNSVYINASVYTTDISQSTSLVNSRFGIIPITAPCNITNSEINSRISTFSSKWDDYCSPDLVSVINLCKEGFYYTNYKDIVICFSCGGRLGKWNEYILSSSLSTANGNDFVFKRHYSNFPHCNFIQERLIQLKTPIISSPPVESQTIDHHKPTVLSSIHEVVSKPETIIVQKPTCVVCLFSESVILLLPCGHLCCCIDCNVGLLTCPICRKHKTGYIRAFIS